MDVTSLLIASAIANFLTSFLGRVGELQSCIFWITKETIHAMIKLGGQCFTYCHVLFLAAHGIEPARANL